MLKHRVLTLSLALFLIAGGVAPWVAQGDIEAPPSRERPGKRRVPPTAHGSRASAVDQEARTAADTPKRDGNGLGRVLGAPFRAFARLFGGNKKEQTARQPRGKGKTERAAVQKVEETPAVRDNVTAASAEAPMAARAAAPQASRPSPPAENGARVVRPAEPVSEDPPRRWVPVIGGVPNDPLSQGRALLEHGHFNEAVAELSVAAASIAPGVNLVEANNLLGLSYARLGRHAQAAECYRRALTVAPNDPVVLANLGNSLYLSNDVGGAHKVLKQAARLSPGMATVHNSLGVVQTRLGKYEDAFKSFARATGEYDAHIKVAAVLESVSRDRQAVKHYEAALRLQPNTSAVLARLAVLYERTGERDKAETARRALGLPADPRRTTTGGG